MDSQAFHEIVSGRRRGAAAAAARALLRLAEAPYHAAVAWRNRRYDRGKSAVHRVPVPVVSVGNVTVGGTGKTPMVAWLAHWFRRQQVRVCLISRGYGAEAGGRNDEALELEQELPDVPHLQNPDRVAAAETAVEELATQLILLDDAFQHRRIHRDLDVVLIDALAPFGYDHLLPRGLLRESLGGLARADVIAISRCDLVDAAQREAIVARLRNHAPRALLAEVAHRAQGLIGAGPQRAELAQLAGQPLVAFCGIGNPEGFRRTLEACGCHAAGFREFADHHDYTAEDVRELSRWAESLGAAAAVCTRKDLVKIRAERLGDTPLWALGIGIEFLSGREDLEQRLQSILSLVRRGPEAAPA